MLFDHGCDAVTTGIIAIAVCRVLSVNKLCTSLVMGSCCFLFFLATLEQYYTHFLYLPKINAVSEGVWGLALLCIISGIVGPEVWLYSPAGFENNKFILMTFLGLFVATCFYHTKKILAKASKMDYYLKFRFPLIFIIICWLMHLCSPSFKDYTFMLSTLFNVSKITILCQIAHITEKEFQPIRFANLAIMVIGILCFGFSVANQDISSIKQTLFALSALDFLNFSTMISKRMAKILGIKIFVVKKTTNENTSARTGIPEHSIENQDFKKEHNNESIPDDNI